MAGAKNSSAFVGGYGYRAVMPQLHKTAVHSLQVGDAFLARSEPQGDASETVTVTALEDLEDARQIRVTVEFTDGSFGQMEFPPQKQVRRVVQPGEEPSGMVMVSGDNLWKWVGTNMNDPEGGSEKFLITGFKRSPDGTVWVGLKSHTSDRVFNAQYAADAHIIFEDDER
jgi:hypothetical protein